MITLSLAQAEELFISSQIPAGLEPEVPHLLTLRITPFVFLNVELMGLNAVVVE